MSKNIDLLNVVYSDVPSVQLPQAGGGTAEFYDVSDTTAAASDVAAGKYFYTANGQRTAGTGSGGGTAEVELKLVNFCDYNAKLLYSYTAEEWASVSTLPANPSHDRLTAQGWNMTKAEIDTVLSNYPNRRIWIAQYYKTTSTASELDIELLSAERLSPYLGIAVNGTVTIDWGDNSATETMTGTSLTTQVRKQHTYAATGTYTIKIYATSGTYAFYGTSSISTINNNNTSTLNINAVYSSALRRVFIGNNASVGAYAFYCCRGVEEIMLPNTITSIGNYAFSGTNANAAVVIPSTVQSVGNYAFYDNANLYTLICLEGVQTLGNYALQAQHIGRVYLPTTLTTINTYACQGWFLAEEIEIPDSVTSIGTYAFRTARLCQKLYISDSVTSIQTYAFGDFISLAEVTIGASCTSIAANAFYNCLGMKAFHFKRTSPPTLSNSNAFSSMPSDCKIYVPYSADHSILNAYKTASNWSTFSSRMLEDPA